MAPSSCVFIAFAMAFFRSSNPYSKAQYLYKRRIFLYFQYPFIQFQGFSVFVHSRIKIRQYVNYIHIFVIQLISVFHVIYGVFVIPIPKFILLNNTSAFFVSRIYLQNRYEIPIVSAGLPASYEFFYFSKSLSISISP